MSCGPGVESRVFEVVLFNLSTISQCSWEHVCRTKRGTLIVLVLLCYSQGVSRQTIPLSISADDLLGGHSTDYLLFILIYITKLMV